MRNIHQLASVLSLGLILATAPAAPSSAATATPGPVTVAGDFNQDGNPDLLWFNASRGVVDIWLMQGFKPHTRVTLPHTTGDTMLHAVGTADFNADGATDILFWHARTGEIYVWYMKGVEIVRKVRFAETVADRFPVSLFDFNGDGFSDILWQSKTGEIIVSIVRDETIVEKLRIDLPSSGPAELWLVRGAGDFDLDGDHDLVVERSSEFGPSSPDADGGNVIGVAILQGTTGTIEPVAVNADQNWEIGAVADWDRDGDPDLMFENDATEQTGAWRMAGTKVQEAILVAGPATSRGTFDLVGPR